MAGEKATCTNNPPMQCTIIVLLLMYCSAVDFHIPLLLQNRKLLGELTETQVHSNQENRLAGQYSISTAVHTFRNTR